MSKLFKKFREAQPMAPEHFQAVVLKVLQSRFPAERWAKDANPDAVRCGEDWQFGLQTIYAEHRRRGLRGADLEDLVAGHFTRVLENARTKPLAPEWPASKPDLRPQLVPAEYGEQVPILAFPFNADVVATVVIDLPHGYSLVRPEDADRWGVTPGELFAAATENLNTASANVRAQAIQGPNRCIGIQEMDGYDAARILVPGFRHFLGTHLSFPFFAAVPNRDFLIAWADDCEPGFHEFAKQKVVKDFGERPYPLSAGIVRVREDGIEAIGRAAQQ